MWRKQLPDSNKQLYTVERIGTSALAPMRIWRKGSFCKKGRVAYDEIKLASWRLGKILDPLLRHLHSSGPGRTEKIGLRTCRCNRKRVNSLNLDVVQMLRSLGQHECDQPGTCADVQNGVGLSRVGPGAEQHAIGTYRMHAWTLFNEEAPESKRKRHRGLFLGRQSRFRQAKRPAI